MKTPMLADGTVYEVDADDDGPAIWKTTFGVRQEEVIDVAAERVRILRTLSLFTENEQRLRRYVARWLTWAGKAPWR